MTPEQRAARRRIDAIYGDQSHPYWHGDRDATREMEGYFQTLHPKPAESPRGATDSSGASAAAVDQGLGQTAERRTARQRIDSIYGDQSHPYWHGDPGATRETEGYFQTLNPEPVEGADRTSIEAPILPTDQETERAAVDAAREVPLMKIRNEIRSAREAHERKIDEMTRQPGLWDRVVEFFYPEQLRSERSAAKRMRRNSSSRRRNARLPRGFVVWG